MKADWVVLTGHRDPFAACERCGAYLEVELPMRLLDLAKIMRAFLGQHQACKAQQVER